MADHLYTSIKRAYTIIGDRTPLTVDCGQLCEAACCKGDDYGMLLFPGEAVHLADVPNFKISRIKYMDGRAWHLACDGVCDRAVRPLACRIFPLAPHIDQAGRVSALPDPRAARVCPLADGKYLDRRFQKSVNKAFLLLAQEPKIRSFMQMLSDELTELRRFVL